MTGRIMDNMCKYYVLDSAHSNSFKNCIRRRATGYTKSDIKRNKNTDYDLVMYITEKLKTRDTENTETTNLKEEQGKTSKARDWPLLIKGGIKTGHNLADEGGGGDGSRQISKRMVHRKQSIYT
jgi:hypothetical protein